MSANDANFREKGNTDLLGFRRISTDYFFVVGLLGSGFWKWSNQEFLAAPSASDDFPSESSSDYLAEPSGRAEREELAEGEVALGIGVEILLGGTSKRLKRKARPEGTRT